MAGEQAQQLTARVPAGARDRDRYPHPASPSPSLPSVLHYYVWQCNFMQILVTGRRSPAVGLRSRAAGRRRNWHNWPVTLWQARLRRSEEHTSKLQSRVELGCRLLLEKKKLLLGAAELVLGVWAVRWWQRSLVTLLTLVRVWAIFHGLSEIFAGFSLRLSFLLMGRRARCTPFPYTTLFR